jgi:hypothetical protein
MATNPSNKEKTLKSMFIQMPLDNWVLDNLQTFCNYKNLSIMPSGNILDDYRDYFESNGFLEEIELDKKYWYSPAMFAEDYYGTPDLDFLVLYFAKKTSVFEFNTKKILALIPERLNDINKIILARKTELKELNANPPTYLI